MSEKNHWGNVPEGKIKTLSSPPPVLYAVASALKFFEQGKNKYQLYRDFIKMDPEVRGAVMRVSLMISYAYKGVQVHAEHELDEQEKALLNILKKFDKTFDIRSLFFSIGKHLMRDGDDVFVGHFEDGIGLTQFQPLPIHKVTALNSRDQIGSQTDLSVYITTPKFYVLNEASESQQIFPENDHQRVFHFSLDNTAEIIMDIKNRKTFGVWSQSILETLESRVLWKQALLIADILWRYRNIPREEHILNLEAFDPAFFEGETQEIRIAAAKTAIEKHLKSYAESISKKKVDQGFVHGQDVEIKYVEPQKVTFVSPNEVTDKINESICAVTSAPSSAIIGRSRGTFATELLVASYTILLPEFIVYKVKTKLLEVVREHIRRINLTRQVKFTDDQIDQVDIKTSLILQMFQGEIVRQIAVLAAAGTHTQDELRAKLGDDPIKDEQINRLLEIAKGGRTGDYANTLADILRPAERQRETQEPLTPESRRDKQET